MIQDRPGDIFFLADVKGNPHIIAVHTPLICVGIGIGAVKQLFGAAVAAQSAVHAASSFRAVVCNHRCIQRHICVLVQARNRGFTGIGGLRGLYILHHGNRRACGLGGVLYGCGINRQLRTGGLIPAYGQQAAVCQSRFRAGLALQRPGHLLAGIPGSLHTGGELHAAARENLSRLRRYGHTGHRYLRLLHQSAHCGLQINAQLLQLVAAAVVGGNGRLGRLQSRLELGKAADRVIRLGISRFKLPAQLVQPLMVALKAQLCISLVQGGPGSLGFRRLGRPCSHCPGGVQLLGKGRPGGAGAIALPDGLALGNQLLQTGQVRRQLHGIAIFQGIALRVRFALFVDFIIDGAALRIQRHPGLGDHTVYRRQGVQDRSLGIGGSKDLHGGALLQTGGREGRILLPQLNAAGGPAQSYGSRSLRGRARLRCVIHTGPAAVGHLGAGAVQHIIEQAAALGIQLQALKRGDAHAPLLIGLVGLNGLDHSNGLLRGQICKQPDLTGVLVEHAVFVGIGAGGILHGDVVHHNGIRRPLAVLYGDVALIRRRRIVDGGLLVDLKLIDPNGFPSGVVALRHVQLDISGCDGLVQVSVRHILLVTGHRVCHGVVKALHSFNAGAVVRVQQGAAVVRRILEVKVHRIHVHALTGAGTVGMVDHPSLNGLVLPQVDYRVALGRVAAPLAAVEHRAVVELVNGAVCHTGHAGNNRLLQSQVFALFKHRHKTVLHFFRPGNGEGLGAALYKVLGIGDNFKGAGGLSRFLFIAAQVEGVAGGRAYKLPGPVGVHPIDPVHKGVLGLFPVHPGFHGLIRGVNHFVQRDAGRGLRSGTVGCEGHLTYVDGIVLHAVGSRKAQGDGNGSLSCVFRQIDGGGIPLAVCRGGQGIEFKVFRIVGIAEAQAQLHLDTGNRRLIGHGKFAVLRNLQLRAIELDVVGFSRIHGAGQLHGGAGIPGIGIVDDGIQLLALGFDDPTPGGQHIGQGPVVPAVLFAHHFAILIEAVAVTCSKIGDKIRADDRSLIGYQAGKAAEFIGRTVCRRRIIGGSHPQLLILIIQEILGAGSLGQGAGGSQDTQRAFQDPIFIQTGLIVSALYAGHTGHRPVFPGGVNVPRVDAGLLGGLNGAVYVAVAGHIQPPVVRNPGVSVLHPGLDAAGGQAAGAVVPGNGKVIGLNLLEILQEFFKAGHAGTGFGIEDIAVKAVILCNFHQLVGGNETTVFVLLYHFSDKLIAIGAVAPGEENGAGRRHAVAVGRIDDLRGGNGNGALGRGTAPEVENIHILEIIKYIGRVPVSSLGRRLTRPGVGHGQGHHLGIPGGQWVDIGSHPTLCQGNGAAVIPGIRIVVRAPVFQLVDLETRSIGLQRLIFIVILIGNFQWLRPIAQNGSGCGDRLRDAGKGAGQQGCRTQGRHGSFQKFQLRSSIHDVAVWHCGQNLRVQTGRGFIHRTDTFYRYGG